MGQTRLLPSCEIWRRELLFQTDKPNLLFVRKVDFTFLLREANPRMERFTRSPTTSVWPEEGGSFGFKGKIELANTYFVPPLQCFKCRWCIAITHPDICKRWPIPKLTFALNSKEILHKNTNRQTSYFISAAARSFAILTLVMSLLALELILSKVWFCRWRAVFMSFDMFRMLPIIALTCNIIFSLTNMKTFLSS